MIRQCVPRFKGLLAMGRHVVLISMATVLCAVGCGKDYKQIADADVQTRLLDQLEKKEAIPFFEQKGIYYDDDENNKTTVDRDIVLPLLRRLKEIADTKQWVILRDDDKNWAHALLIGLPRDAKTVDRMADAVQEADDKFSGFILQQWGHEWLSIILIDKESYEFLKKDDPDIDKQR